MQKEEEQQFRRAGEVSRSHQPGGTLCKVINRTAVSLKRRKPK